jgi:hypothetical protein
LSPSTALVAPNLKLLSLKVEDWVAFLLVATSKPDAVYAYGAQTFELVCYWRIQGE